jgi:hypothetical protein
MRFRFIALSIAALLLGQVGCASHPQQTANSSNVSSINLPPGETANPDDILGTDPSAVRLQNLGGDFLLYMRVYGQMPAKLEDLRAVDDQAGANTVNSPAVGQPYVYVPRGLWLSGHSNDIVVFDPALTKRSMRWCLFLGPRRGNGSFSVDVVALPESVFKTYKPSAP